MAKIFVVYYVVNLPVEALSPQRWCRRSVCWRQVFPLEWSGASCPPELVRPCCRYLWNICPTSSLMNICFLTDENIWWCHLVKESLCRLPRISSWRPGLSWERGWLLRTLTKDITINHNKKYFFLIMIINTPLKHASSTDWPQLCSIIIVKTMIIIFFIIMNMIIIYPTSLKQASSTDWPQLSSWTRRKAAVRADTAFTTNETWKVEEDEVADGSRSWGVQDLGPRVWTVLDLRPKVGGVWIWDPELEV